MFYSNDNLICQPPTYNPAINLTYSVHPVCFVCFVETGSGNDDVIPQGA